MTSDQERALDHLCFINGGWIKIDSASARSIRAQTAGDQPDYEVHTDGSTLSTENELRTLEETLAL